LDIFRTKINSCLRKGHTAQALELTSPSGEIASEERRELFNNFDRAFVVIFPDFIEVVNSCLKPEQRIVPKRTEILSNELRILALIKLGIKDNTDIAGMLHCSVKTVQNLRSILKARLAIPEEEFNSIISLL
jgi:DNA-binding NarL/FixJ family response regulator